MTSSKGHIENRKQGIFAYNDSLEYKMLSMYKMTGSICSIYRSFLSIIIKTQQGQEKKIIPYNQSLEGHTQSDSNRLILHPEQFMRLIQ